MDLLRLGQAFALLASPTSGIPPLDPRPVIQHAASVADQAWFLSGDKSTGVCFSYRFLNVG